MDLYIHAGRLEPSVASRERMLQSPSYNIYINSELNLVYCQRFFTAEFSFFPMVCWARLSSFGGVLRGIVQCARQAEESLNRSDTSVTADRIATLTNDISRRPPKLLSLVCCMRARASELKKSIVAAPRKTLAILSLLLCLRILLLSRTFFSHSFQKDISNCWRLCIFCSRGTATTDAVIYLL